tara:strand:+ start:217 stop:486 length:270 start_codon:yes stop_codon:yes gene_type:complete
MTRGHDVRIGERYKQAGRTAFGDPSDEVFEVRDIRVEGCIVPHAQLFNVTNPLDQRLISVDALRDVKFYVPVDLQSIEFQGQISDSWKL